MTSEKPDRNRRAPSRPPSREEIGILVIVGVLGVVWGALWKRSAALVEVSSFLPILLLVVGPGVLVFFLAYRGATGSLYSRMVGYATGAVVLGAVIGNLLTPALPSSVDVNGHVSGTLDGQGLDQAATCRWGPGRTAVIRVTSTLPALVGDNLFTAGVPAGTLVVELPSGSVSVQDISSSLGAPTMPLRIGGGVDEGDRAQGSVALVAGQNATVTGELHWSCDPAPAP